MKKRLYKLLLSTFAALLLGLSVPTGAFAQSLEEAARQAARQYDAKVLSARTVELEELPVMPGGSRKTEFCEVKAYKHRHPMTAGSG